MAEAKQSLLNGILDEESGPRIKKQVVTFKIFEIEATSGGI